MAAPSSLPSKSVMGFAAVVTVIAAGVAGVLAFTPAKDATPSNPPATPVETTTDTQPNTGTASAVADASSTPAASRENDDGEIVEAANRSDAEAQSKQRRCFQNLFPVNIIQKLNDDDFLAYSKFSVGYLAPVLLTFTGQKRPTSSGSAMLSPKDGIRLAGTQTIEMENGFSRTATLLTVGDQRCARLWAVIERDLEAARVTARSTQEDGPRRSAEPRGSEVLRETINPPSEAAAGEVSGLADADP